MAIQKKLERSTLHFNYSSEYWVEGESSIFGGTRPISNSGLLTEMIILGYLINLLK